MDHHDPAREPEGLGQVGVLEVEGPAGELELGRPRLRLEGVLDDCARCESGHLEGPSPAANRLEHLTRRRDGSDAQEVAAARSRAVALDPAFIEEPPNLMHHVDA